MMCSPYPLSNELRLSTSLCLRLVVLLPKSGPCVALAADTLRAESQGAPDYSNGKSSSWIELRLFQCFVTSSYGFSRFHEVFDDDDVGSEAGDGATKQSGSRPTAGSRDDLVDIFRANAGLRKQRLIQVAVYLQAKVARERVSQLARVAGNNDLETGIPAQIAEYRQPDQGDGVLASTIAKCSIPAAAPASNATLS